MLKRNIQIKAFTCLFAVAIVLVGLSGSVCLADLYTDLDPDLKSGSITSSLGEIITDGTWATGEVTVSWDITGVYDADSDPTDLDYFHYEYTFTAPVAPALSHFVLQVSPEFAAEDLFGLLYGPGDLAAYGPDTFDGVWGVKFEDQFSSDLTQTWSFNSYREPMWGDFFAKAGSEIGGQYGIAYNSGFGKDPYDGTNLDDYAYIARIDTHYVPTPGAVLLGILGLGIAGLKLRKYA
jgi:hypothetical protein